MMKRLVIILSMACMAIGCAKAPSPNVVLIVLDTLRADRLSCMGYGRPTTPRIDALAATGTLYTNAFATCFWTLPSHASLFTGLHPVQAGATSETLHLPEENMTLAEVMSLAGYRTVGFVCNSWVSKERGFAQGFQEFVEMWRTENQDRMPGVEQSLETMTVDKIEPWIKSVSTGERPFFLFANLNGTHLPYRPADEYLQQFLHDGYDPGRVRELAELTSGWSHLVGDTPLSESDYRILSDLYDGEVAWADALVGRVIDALDRAGVLDNTLVIVTSDHGEHLGEHDRIDHFATMYDPALHVPLVIHYPRAFEAGLRKDDLVSLVDIAPTVLGVCGAGDRAPQLHAETSSLASPKREKQDFIIAGNEKPVTGIQLLQSKYPGYDWQSIDYRLRCLRAPAHKLIWNEGRGVELYNLAKDPGETSNLADAQPDMQRQMMGVLTKTYEKMGTTKEHFMFESTDQESLELLRSLGYIN
ncbi:MAG TPA: sulfatase [Candidatus Krumholzibacteria bacterium]|nr:sulfatase [Candidatus Krumholzibacteria bacterium]